MKKAFEYLNRNLDGGQRYMTGDDLTIVDISMATNISLTEIKGYMMDKWPDLAMWYRRMKALPYWAECNKGLYEWKTPQWWKQKNEYFIYIMFYLHVIHWYMYILLQIKYCMNTCIQCLNFADNRIPVHVFTVTKTISIGQAVTSLFVSYKHYIQFKCKSRYFFIPNWRSMVLHTDSWYTYYVKK